jgi:hypothetical protein
MQTPKAIDLWLLATVLKQLKELVAKDLTLSIIWKRTKLKGWEKFF